MIQTEIKYRKDLSLTVLFWAEENDYFFYCPALDLTGRGKSAREARESFDTVLKEFLLQAQGSDTLLDELEKLGWMINKNKRRIHAPDFSQMLEDNETLRQLQNKRNIRKVLREISLML